MNVVHVSERLITLLFCTTYKHDKWSVTAKTKAPAPAYAVEAVNILLHKSFYILQMYFILLFN